MDINLIVLVSILILGSSYTAYKIGVKEGIMATVNFIEENDLMEFDDIEKNDT
tara:strand:+ start:133 stop:291 length:159 start_codon:yes stop_codon:yes gene_type:complete